MYQAVILSTVYDISNGKYALIMSHLVLLTPLLPLDFYLIYDLLCLINKRFLEKEHSKSRFKDEFFEVTHPQIFSNLAHVKYAFLDKTGTLTENTFKMSHIFFNGKIFQFENLEKLYANMKTQNTERNNSLQVKPSINNSNPSRDEIGSYIFDGKEMKTQSPLMQVSESPLMQVSPNINNGEIKKKLNSQFSPKRSIAKIQTSKSTNNFFRASDPSKNTKKEKSLLKMNDPYNGNEDLEKEIDVKNSVSRTNQKYQTLNLMNYKTKELDKSLTYIDFIYDQDDFFSDFYKSKKVKGNFEFQELFECFSLCHSSKSRISPYTKQIFYESEHKEEEVLLEFSKNCNFVYERSDNLQNPEEYYIFYKNFKYKYHLMGINNFTYQRKLFSLVYKHPFFGKYFLICKGSFNAIKSKLSLKPDEEEKLENIIRQFHNKGLIPMIYSKRELIKEEAEVFRKKMKNLKSSLINQSDQLEKLANDIEINLRIICVIGFKNDLKPDAIEAVDFLKSLNIDTWLLTGDTKENALQAAFSSNLIDLSNEALNINVESKKDLLFIIRSILSDLKNLSFNKFDIKDITDSTKSLKLSKNLKTGQTYFKKCDKFIFLSGKSFEIICSDSYLMPNFIFICTVVNMVIAYDMAPAQKALLVKMVQTSFPKNPSVLAIGDGYNDISMLQAADISVEIVNKTSDGIFNPIMMAGDLKLSSLKQLKSLMLNNALLFSDRLSYIFYLLHYKSMIFGLQIFLYNFYDNFSGSVFFDSMFVFLYYNYFLLFDIIIVGIFQRRVSFKTIKKCQHLYIHGILLKKFKEIKSNIVKLFTEVTLQTLIIFYLTIYSVGKSVNNDGKPFDKDMLSVMGLYTCLIMNIIKIYMDFRFSFKTFHIIPFFVASPIIHMIVFFQIRPLLTFLPLRPYEIYSSEIFENFILVMNLLYNGIVAFLASYALKHFWSYIFLPNPFELIKNRDFIKKYRKNHSHILNLFFKTKKYFYYNN